jgi:2-(1,2-epoxy-1,2-dihydrophenyl)acetyl-CoA isomerase
VNESDELQFWRTDGVAWLRFNRPRARNAITDGMRTALASHIATIAEDDEARCVVLTGAGSAFCAGADFAYLRALSTQTEAESRAMLETSIALYGAILEGLRGMPKPTVAAMNGPAAGIGAAVALACDMRFATPEASLTLPFIKLGLSPDGGTTWTLSRLIGMGRAFELLLTGGRLTSTEAERLGVVNRVVPATDLDAAVGELARQIAAAPGEAVTATKQALRAAEGLSFGEALRREFEIQAPLRRSADFQARVAAVLERGNRSS